LHSIKKKGRKGRSCPGFRNLPGGQKFKALVPIIRGSDHRNLLASNENLPQSAPEGVVWIGDAPASAVRPQFQGFELQLELLGLSRQLFRGSAGAALFGCDVRNRNVSVHSGGGVSSPSGVSGVRGS
jgi:hypothetical protein